MGMLGAFARGVAGPGLLGVVDRMDRRDAVAQEMAARERDREEERKFRAEQAKLDRFSREEVAGIRKGGSKSGSGSGGGDDAGGSEDDYMVAALMDKYGVSAAKAKQMLESSRADTNPFPAKEVADESGGHSAPDLTRWAELNRTIAKAMRDGRSMAKSNYAQLTEGEGNAQRNTIVGGMLAGKLTPAQAAEGVAATKGEGAHGKGGVNEFDGTADAVGKSEIGKNNAQAGSANRANRDAMDGLKLPAAVKAEIANLDKRESELAGAITKAQAEDTWNPEQSPGQKQLQANLAAVRMRRSQLIAPYMAGGKGGNADPLGLMGGDKPAAPSKPSQADVRKSEPKEAAPAAPAKPDPFAGMSFAERKQAILERERAAKERERAIKSSPEMQSLRQQHQAAIRAGDVVRANAIMDRINKMLREAA